MYFSNEFKLVQEPLIEAIPQYQPGQVLALMNLSTMQKMPPKKKIEGLGELLTLVELIIHYMITK